MKLPIPPAGASVQALRASGFAVIFLSLALWLACGNYYRPVATPVIPTQPNPNFHHVAVMLSDNGNNNAGASTTIDVSGDSDVSQATVGLMPVHAAIVLSATRVYVANRLDDTVSEFAPAVPTPVTTISLPTGSAPVFVNTTETGTGNIYVADSGSGTLAVISMLNNVLTNTITVGTNPVSIAETPNAQALYVANAGSNTVPGSVSSINPIDQIANPPVAASAPWVSPVWAVARPDSERVYILDKGSGFVSAINAVTNTVVATASVGVGADFMTFDPRLYRIYVTNPVNGTLTFLDATSDALTASTATVPNAVSVAPLGDGTRVYVTSAAVSGSTVTSQVTVLYAVDLSVKTIIPLTSVSTSAACATRTWSELSTAASADYSRVYVANCDAGNIAIIQTSSDTLVLDLSAPYSAQKPATAGGVPPPQNPVFVVAGP
jgi:YVTN family beta-propeller protein